MTTMTLDDIAQKMRSLDIAHFTTVTDDGELAARPMSNNGDVEYDGNSYYFSYEQARVVSDIARNSEVSLSFNGRDDLYVTVNGTAELIRDKPAFEAHWVPDLERWFEKGVDTPGLVLIKVQAARVKFWKGEEQGEWIA